MSKQMFSIRKWSSSLSFWIIYVCSCFLSTMYSGVYWLSWPRQYSQIALVHHLHASFLLEMWKKTGKHHPIQSCSHSHPTCQHWESNPRHSGDKTSALPTELTALCCYSTRSQPTIIQFIPTCWLCKPHHIQCWSALGFHPHTPSLLLWLLTNRYTACAKTQGSLLSPPAPPCAQTIGTAVQHLTAPLS